MSAQAGPVQRYFLAIELKLRSLKFLAANKTFQLRKFNSIPIRITSEIVGIYSTETGHSTQVVSAQFIPSAYNSSANLITMSFLSLSSVYPHIP